MSQHLDEIRNQCSQLVHAFAYFVDHREFSEAVALFSDDGEFERPDGHVKGHAEIAALWANRPASIVTRHLCGVAHFTEISATTATAVTPFTLYQTQHDGEGLPQVSKPAGIGEFTDKFILTDNGWKIAHRRGMPVLMYS